ncbi:MAG: hypothetical protein Q8Q60_01420 [Candidatus Chromulinivorax sp.]|nr:hypothetical protein [Candidatus Chromulinivorax sp.]
MKFQSFFLIFMLLVNCSFIFCSDSGIVIFRKNNGNCSSCTKYAWLDVNGDCVSCTHRYQRQDNLPQGVSAIPINELSLTCKEVRDRAIAEDETKNRYKAKEISCLDRVLDCFKRRN